MHSVKWRIDRSNAPSAIHVSGYEGENLERLALTETRKSSWPGQLLIFHSPLGVRHQVRRYW
jgi:hypothetical protein